MRILHGPRFLADLDAIVDHARMDAPDRARAFVEEIRTLCRETIAAHPRIGRRRPELGPRRRSFATHGRTIFYSVDDDADELRFDRLLGKQEAALW